MNHLEKPTKKIIPTLDSDIQKVIISQLNAIKAKNANRFEQSVNSVLN